MATMGSFSFSPSVSEGDKDTALLLAHLSDLLERRDGGEIVFSCFLSPREQHITQRWLARCGREKHVRMMGGFDGAERCMAAFLPDYLLDLADCADNGEELILESMQDSVNEAMAVLMVLGSGYRTLTHRDVLGSLLSLGLERDTVGDIVFLPFEETGREQSRAYVVVSERIAPFLLSEWKRIGNDAVRIRRDQFPEGFVFERKVRAIGDTVASNRLDCVISSLTNTAREKAQSLIRAGLVELDYETEQRPDRRLTPPAVISVRGHGKFRLLSLGEVTKKGRLRLRAEQYL